MSKIDKHFVSEIDKKMAEFDATHAKSPAQMAELKKYQQIFEDLLTLLKNYFEADCFKSIAFISGVSDFKSCKSSISLSDKPLFSG